VVNWDASEAYNSALRVKGGLREDRKGPWWFRYTYGVTSEGRKALVIWRNRPGRDNAEGVESDGAVLSEWFASNKSIASLGTVDIVYVNGDNSLASQRPSDAFWVTKLTEQEFHRLMFASEGL
jgi:adenine-specific DNA-methyltransferase